MKKQLHSKSKKIICLCLFSSGVLFYNNAWSNSMFRDSIPKAKNDSVKKVAASAATNLPPQNIPVLFGEQSQSRLVESVGYLNGQKLENSPVSLVKNAFVGQLAGLNSTQTTGMPRYDNPILSLRGKNPLIMIDGVPVYNLVSLTKAVVTSGTANQTIYDQLSINPEQIESVVLLKDALSTAILGNQGMDGVLMITTKKGGGASNSLTFTGEAGIQTPIGMRHALSAYDYASLYNEASVNSGGPTVYSPAQLNGYKNGSDPYLYPNVNWQSAVLKNNAPIQHYNLSDGGSSANLRYFLSLDYEAQGGLLNEDPSVAYGTNVDYKRYVLRSNIDIKLDDRLSASFNLLGNIQDYYQPGAGAGAVFSNMLNTPANATPIYNQGATFAGTRDYSANPYAQSTATGYLKDNLQAATATISVKRDMGDVLKGMYVKALISYAPSYEQQIDRSKNFNAYNYPVPSDTANFLRVNMISDQLNNATVIERFQQTYADVSAGIDRTWKKNAISGLIIGRYDNTHGDNTLNEINQGIAGRVNYSYDKRFNLEAAGAYNGNNQFAPGHQYGFYPSAGASWNIDKEQFFKDVHILNQVKLRATYGTVGNANPGYYAYQQNYSSGTAYFFGTGPTSSPSVFQGALANPNRVTEKANKLDIGLDLTYSKQHGWLNFDYFDNREYDLLQVTGTNTAILGQTYPVENIGKDRYYGVELNTGWADRVGQLHYSVSGNISTTASRVIYNDQQPVPYSYLVTEGNPVNQIRGYVADGFFNSGNLNAATMSGYKPSPGDVKYKDLNDDGIINQYDAAVIGNKKPQVFYGASLNLQYKGFDFNVMFAGVANHDILTTGAYEFPFTNNGLGNAFQNNLNRWTPQTAATATLPRVTLGTDINNYIASSLFVHNDNYLRLKNAEFGYSFSNKLLSSAKVKSVRFFIKGENLLTWSKYKESDPEDYTGLYPLQRVIDAGLSVKL